jgi:hypothetical protein
MQTDCLKVNKTADNTLHRAINFYFFYSVNIAPVKDQIRVLGLSEIYILRYETPVTRFLVLF